MRCRANKTHMDDYGVYQDLTEILFSPIFSLNAMLD
jgi:hypothetical protein